MFRRPPLASVRGIGTDAQRGVEDRLGAHTTLIHWGGDLGIAVAAMAFYLAASELCEAVYERTVLPVWPLSKA